MEASGDGLPGEVTVVELFSGLGECSAARGVL